MESSFSIIKRLLVTFLISKLSFLHMLKAEVDKDALPNVEEGFQINFFVKEPTSSTPPLYVLIKKVSFMLVQDHNTDTLKRILQRPILKSSSILITMALQKRLRLLLRV